MDEKTKQVSVGEALIASSQQPEFRARVARLSPHNAVLEINDAALLLRVSQVIPELTIRAGDVKVYTGRAVVSGAIDKGTGTLCELQLADEGFQTGAGAVNGAASTQTNYDAFMRQWGRVYRIVPEYKLALADMESFLTELRLWLERATWEHRARYGAAGSEAETELAARLAVEVVPGIHNLFERFESVASQLDADAVPAHWAYGQRLLHPLLLVSPFVHRTYFKPLGYAGDFEMVNMMFRDPLQGPSLYAKMINAYALQLPPIIGHRNRIDFLTQKIMDEAARLALQHRPLRVFNLGCGPAQEIQKFMASTPLADQAILTLADFNDDTLQKTAAILNQIKQQHQRQVELNLVKRTAHQVLKQGERLLARDSKEVYDLIYCAGLFDYLTDKVCLRLMEIFYRMLAPGGLLIATNVDTHPSRQEMECFLEWHLIHRNTKQMRALAPKGPTDDGVRITRDLSGVNVFLEVRKPL